MSSEIGKQVSQIESWRGQCVAAIQSYKDWLEDAGGADDLTGLRIYDLIESLKNDRLVLAFVAEFSRGKSELINALFFADLKQRLLPSDIGRTTMCPTEIFFDAEQQPYLWLLPIETRKRDETIANFKQMPVEWSRVRLDVNSRENMARAMKKLTESKRVSRAEAEALDLWDAKDSALQKVAADGTVEIPAWRHALINYPHPLLKAGLVILDTPGLNALGAEPELTLSMLPKAQAALFLLGVDTGVTQSDMQIWERFIRGKLPHQIAVLNKIDLCWDELKSEAEILNTVERQRLGTAKQLAIPPTQVFAVSAQKGLVGKVRGDAALLKRSGLTTLEDALAKDIIPARQAILRNAALAELGTLLNGSLKSVQDDFTLVNQELAELKSLSGKNREVTKDLLAKVRADKIQYDESVTTFNAARGLIMQQSKLLIASLAEDKIEETLEKYLNSINGSWTTSGLTRGMHGLFKQANHQCEKILKNADLIRLRVDALYEKFHEKHGFEKQTPPSLNLDKFQNQLLKLTQETDRFCSDPVHIMMEKRFLVRKFATSLVAEARAVFAAERTECQNWLRDALAPLTQQVREHKMHIDRRLANIHQIDENIETLEARMKELEARRVTLGNSRLRLAKIRDTLHQQPAPADGSEQAEQRIERRRAGMLN